MGNDLSRLGTASTVLFRRAAQGSRWALDAASLQVSDAIDRTDGLEESHAPLVDAADAQRSFDMQFAFQVRNDFEAVRPMALDIKWDHYNGRHLPMPPPTN